MARIVDINTAMTRAVAVLGATMLVFIALRSRRGTEGQSPRIGKPDLIGRDDGNERKVGGKNVLGRILRFLKDFF